MSTEKPKKVAQKRKADNSIEKDAPPDKKQDVGETKLIALFVKNIPSSEPQFCFNECISSGLVIGFSIQEIANILFNQFYGDAVASETQQSEIEARIGKWIDGGVKVSLTKPYLYVVTDGPPIAMSENAKKNSDARISSSQKNLSVYISKFFAGQSPLPSVAIGVGVSKDDVMAKIKRYIEENVEMDIRPMEYTQSHPETGQIMQVDLKEPGFYRLASGAPYPDYCNV